MIKLTKSMIDRAGTGLARPEGRDEYQLLELEEAFDAYRTSHLEPLSETTIDLQYFLKEFGSPYYIAQRLKRKPQIVRKLRRLSTRLSQLQDIGGCRIVVHKNSDVDHLLRYLKDRIPERKGVSITRITDYRVKGRDDTGYRAVHVLITRDGVALELQIRSRIQHYWSENIERTSVIYGHHLKEKEGDVAVIQYFKALSDAFHELEAGRSPPLADRIEIDRLTEVCEQIIRRSDKRNVFDSFVNKDLIKTLVAKESGNTGSLNNWILVFDWKKGAFTSWDVVGRDSELAVQKYIDYENHYSSELGFEVVLIGSSDIATVRETHSHYFGIETYDSVLENFDASIRGFSRKIDIDVGARQILACMHRRRYWGTKSITPDTLKNHFCQDVLTFESSLKTLQDRELVIGARLGGVSLNIRQKAAIEQYLA